MSGTLRDDVLAAVRDVRLFLHMAARTTDHRSRQNLVTDAIVALREAL